MLLLPSNLPVSPTPAATDATAGAAVAETACPAVPVSRGSQRASTILATRHSPSRGQKTSQSRPMTDAARSMAVETRLAAVAAAGSRTPDGNDMLV